MKVWLALIKGKLGWFPTFDVSAAVKKTVEWTKEWIRDNKAENIDKVMICQINEAVNGITG